MLEEGRNQEIKFEQIMENGEEDRISALSDCLLLEILSRLDCTKDAIRTGALSKRWQHLWTWVPALIFTDQCLQNSNSCLDFVSFVDKTLSQCRQLKLKKFQVRTLYDIRFESQFRNWIRFAVNCKVEELNLRLRREKGEFVLDQFVFINSCFTDLTLEGCKLNPSGAISWENLRSLCISWVNVDEELLVNIISGSPLLETFVLEYCEWPKESESESDMIEASASTRLSLTQCRELKHLKKVKLCIIYDIESHPHINNSIHYAIRCNMKELNLEFWHVYSEDEFMVDQILFTGSCITELTLQGCKLNPVGEISWKSLRFLRISKYRSLDEDLIEKILSGSPVLETLELNRCYGFRRLDITSKSVKNLMLCGLERPYNEYEDDVIEINAPHILSLSISWENILCKVLLLNVCSLVKAYLNYTCTKYDDRQETPSEKEQEMLKGFIRNLGHVKELQLGNISAKVLSCLQAQGFVSPSNVKPRMLTGGSHEGKAFLNYTCTKNKHRQEEEQEMLKGLIMNLRHVKELQLGQKCAKALSRLEGQGFVSPSNVKLSGRM